MLSCIIVLAVVGGRAEQAYYPLRSLLSSAVQAGRVGSDLLPTVDWGNEQWAIDRGRDFDCEVCQGVGVAVWETAEAHIGECGAEVGCLEWAVNTAVEKVDEVCGYAKWHDLAEGTETFLTYDMSAACKAGLMSGEWDEWLGDKVQQGWSGGKRGVAEAVGEACLTQGVCGSKDLWKQQQWPWERPTKEERYSTMAEQFMSWNAARAGVEVHPSGVQYFRNSAKNDSSTRVDIDDVVALKVAWNQTLINGYEFGSQTKPQTLVLRKIPFEGVTSVLDVFAEGDDITLFIPPVLALGPKRLREVPPMNVVVMRILLEQIFDGSTLVEEEEPTIIRDVPQMLRDEL